MKSPARRSVIVAFGLFIPLVVESQDVKVKVLGPNCYLFVQQCKPAYKATGTGFKFGGIDFKAGPVAKVGEISLDPKLLEQVGAVV